MLSNAVTADEPQCTWPYCLYHSQQLHGGCMALPSRPVEWRRAHAASLGIHISTWYGR